MASAGITGFSMDGRTGPSVASHRLLTWAGATRGQAAQHALAEALFEAYFAKGAAMCDRDALLAAAAQAGLPRDEAAAALDSPEVAAEMEKELQLGRQLGVTGVPFFRFTDAATGRHLEVSGAQPPEVLARALVTLLPPADAGVTVCKPGGECA